MKFLVNISLFSPIIRNGAGSKIRAHDQSQVRWMMLPLRRKELIIKILSKFICLRVKIKFNFPLKNLEQKKQ
jgi:hypothetical protein